MKLYLRQRLHMGIQSQFKRSEIFIHSTYLRNHWRIFNKVIKMYRQGYSSDYMQNEVIQRLSRRMNWGIFCSEVHLATVTMIIKKDKSEKSLKVGGTVYYCVGQAEGKIRQCLILSN